MLLTQSLSDKENIDGFNILVQGPGWATYEDFIIPCLSQLLATLSNTRDPLSVLEIGPGPKSVLAHLPAHLRRKISRYTAFESNGFFASKLEEWLCSDSDPPLSSLENHPSVHRTEFTLNSNARSGTSTGTDDEDDEFDIILFCHSMYGMKPKRKYLERALEMVAEPQPGGMVILFHRDGALHFDGLVCHQTASFPTGIIRVANDDEVLDRFAAFIAGYSLQDGDAAEAVRSEWRSVCRALARRDEAGPNHLLFSAPDAMMTFTRNATALPELMALVPLPDGGQTVKNREARLQHPAAIIRPTEVGHVQQCVRWALKHEVSLTVIGGGHSGHCLRPNVVSIDSGGR